MELVGGRGKSQKELRVRECAVTVFEVVLNLAAWESAPNPGDLCKRFRLLFSGWKITVHFFKVVTHFFGVDSRGIQEKSVLRRKIAQKHTQIL